MPQFPTRPPSPAPDSVVLRLYEWSPANNNYIAWMVDFVQGRFRLSQATATGAAGEPISRPLGQRRGQRLNLYDYRSPQTPLVVLDIRGLSELRLSEDNTVLRAAVTTFCFWGLGFEGYSIALEIELAIENSQVTIRRIQASDDQAPSVAIGNIPLTKAGLDADPADLRIRLVYDGRYTYYFLNQKIGLHLGDYDRDPTDVTGKWKLDITFPKLSSYFKGAAEFRTLRFDITAHQFNRDSGESSLTGFLLPGSDCGPEVRTKIPLEREGKVSHRDFPGQFTITQRAPLTIKPAPIPPSAGSSYVENVCLLHLPLLPGYVVPEQWNQFLGTYFSALDEVQGGRPISFLPRLSPANRAGGKGVWIVTYRVEDRFDRTDGKLATDQWAISLHQKTDDDAATADFDATLPHVLALNELPIAGAVLKLKNISTGDQWRQLEEELGVVLETPHAIGIPNARGAPTGPLDSRTIRMGALDLEFDDSGANVSTQYATNKLAVRPERCRVAVHIQAGFALKRLMPGGQDDPDGEEYIPENQLNSAFLTACLSSKGDGTLLSEEEEFELKVEGGFQRKRPVVVVPDRQSAPTGSFVLGVAEDARDGSNQTVSLKVTSQRDPGLPPSDSDHPCNAESGSGFVDVLVLDRNPLMVAKVRAQPFTTPDRFRGGAIASWTNVGSTGWQIKAGNNPFCLILPSQGVGEEMEKEKTVANTALAKFKFSPPARLELNANLVAGYFTEAPWNLRRILDVSGDSNSGPALKSVQFEMLYGMFCKVEPQALQLADIFGLVGHIPPRRSPQMRWISSDDAQTSYRQSRLDWSNLYRRYLSRVAVLQPWQALISQTPILKEGMVCTLRAGASTSPLDTTNSSGLKGGALWPVESVNIYSVLSKAPTSDSAEIAGAAFSALGGWGHQKATFNNNLTIINADVAMGRTYHYKLERIGRIAVWWNLAKHVIVYERTVVPTRQFYLDQNSLLGRPILRKVREYVEILEDTRIFPDTLPGNPNITGKNNPDVARRRRGFIESISFPKGAQYNVRGSWGGDVNAGDGNTKRSGWKVPLWNPAAAPADIYPKPKVTLGMHAQSANDPVIVSAEIDDPENLCFFTLTQVGASAPDSDPHAWDPFPDIDYSIVPLSKNSLPDFTTGNLQQVTPDEPAVPLGHGPCTFRVKPQSLPVNVGQERSQKPLSAVLANVTMTRATLKDTIAGVQDFSALPGKANAAVAAVFANLPPVVNAAATLPQTVKDQVKAAIKQNLRDPLDDLQKRVAQQFYTDVQKPISDLKKKLDNLEDASFQQLRDDVKKIQAKVTGSIEEDLTQAVTAFDQWELHFKNQILHQIEDGILQVETAVGAIQHLLLKYAEMAAALYDGAQQRIDMLRGLVVGDIAILSHRAVEAVRQIRDLEARLRAAGQQRPLNWLPDPTEYILSLLGLGDLDQKLSAIEAAVGNAQQLATAIAAIPPNWTEIQFAQLSNAFVSKFLTVAANTRTEVLKALETEGHRFERWRDEMLNQSVAMKTLVDELTTSLPHAGGIAAMKLQAKAAVDNYFNSTVMPALTTLKTALDTQKNNAYQFVAQGANNAVAKVNALADQMEAALNKQAGQVADAVLSAGRDLVQGATEYCDKHFRSVLPPGFDPSPDQILNASDKTAALVRAFGAPPTVPNLDFGRSALGYYFNEADKRIGVTPVLADCNKAAQIANAANGVLESVGVKLPTTQLLDSLIPAELKNFNISSIFPDFAGLKLSNLFQGLKLPAIDENHVKITHDVDPQSRRATVRADVNFGIDNPSTVFSIGPLALDLLTANFNATVKIDAQGTTVRRSVNATLSGVWQVGIGGMAMVKFNGTSLKFDDSGSVRFEISPSQVELPGVMSFVNELLKPTSGGSDGLSMGPIAGGYQCVLSLPVPDMQGATTGISNLTLGARLALMYLPSFEFVLGFYLASKEAPFSLTAFILGGGGYLECNASYRPDNGQLSCSVNLAVTASASIAIALGPIKGGVYVYLGITASFHTPQGSGLNVGAVLLIRGNVDIAGIVTACVSLMLEARYEASKFKARGELSISIKICWCFTLNIHESVEYSIADPNGPHANLRSPSGPLLAVGNLSALHMPLQLRTQDPAVYAIEYTSMLV